MMTFTDFARSHGLLINRGPIADGRWWRVPTDDHQRKRNGAYCYRGDHGWVQNWATMDAPVLWQERRGDPLPALRPLFNPPRPDDGRRQAQERAANEASRLLDSAIRAPHPYLASKGFPVLQGLVSPSGDLLIPMRDCRDYSRVNSVQRIGADGGKKFLAGGKAKGSIFKMGANTPLWLVEGYVTGQSVLAASHCLHSPGTIVVCFSAGNLTYVAHQMSQRPAYVFADNDASGAGEKAAIASGLPYCMRSVEGDANDMHQAVGVRKVAELMRETMG